VWKYRRPATGRLIICAIATILAASAVGKPAIAACVGNDILFSDNFSKPDASWRPTDGAAFRDKRYVVTLQPNGTIIDWPSAFVFDGNYSVCVQVKLPIDPTGAAGSGIAFWVDPGWDGILTMEIQNVTKHQILPLTAGMRFGQMIVHQLDQPALKPYHGRYHGADRVEERRPEEGVRAADRRRQLAGSRYQLS